MIKNIRKLQIASTSQLAALKSYDMNFSHTQVHENSHTTNVLRKTWF